MLEAWRAGDGSAGELLFERYYPTISRFFANKVSSDPADLIQETFMAILQGRDRIRDAAQLRSYLFGAAYNTLRAHYRGRRVDGERLDFGSTSSADLAPGVGTMMASGDEQALLLAALRRIPLELQVVLELFYWEDMTSAAIAELLGEPHGTVRTRIRRARQLVLAALGELTTDTALVRRTATDLDGWAAKVRGAAQARTAAR